MRNCLSCLKRLSKNFENWFSAIKIEFYYSHDCGYINRQKKHYSQRIRFTLKPFSCNRHYFQSILSHHKNATHHATSNDSWQVIKVLTRDTLHSAATERLHIALRPQVRFLLSHHAGSIKKSKYYSETPSEREHIIIC